MPSKLTDLNMWFSLVECFWAVVVPLGGRALLEEVGYWCVCGVGLMAHALTPIPARVFLFPDLLIC